MKWFLIFLAITANAQTAKTEWNLTQGKLTYHVSFPLKNVEGISESVKGKGKCDDKNCEFLVASPLKSFESGDGNRDNHMLEVTKAGPNPVVTARIRIPKVSSTGSMDVPAEINFGGETHTYQVLLKENTKGNETTVTGRIPLKLSDFKLERPSLLGVKINDEVPVDFELHWN